MKQNSCMGLLETYSLPNNNNIYIYIQKNKKITLYTYLYTLDFFFSLKISEKNLYVFFVCLFVCLFFHKFHPRREAGDVWCLPPVWNLRAVIWFHFAISSLVLLPSPVTLSVLSFSACWPFFLNFFQKILQYFSLRDRLFCMAPV